MASIVAYIELREGAITPTSLSAIGESRRIAEAVGATVYGFLAVGPLAQPEIDRLAEQVTAAGADRVLCSSDQTLAGPALDISHGPVLAQLAEHLRPVLFLFPAGGVGIELGPPLAIRIGAAYAPAARVAIHDIDGATANASHRVLLTRWRAGRDSIRRIDVGDLERPVVAALAADWEGDLPGEPCAEVETIPCPAPKHAEIRILGAEADASAGLELCQTLVCVAGATPAADRDELRALLPPEACLRAEDDLDLGTATPRNLLLLSVDPARFPIRAPLVAELSGTAAEIAAALRRLLAGNQEAPP